MFPAARAGWLKLRPWLILGRVSNLPTVWSNCLAAWFLSGGGATGSFALLVGGASCIYVGGMFLNDAWDAEFDRQYRVERPIPAGQVKERTVWWAAFGLFGVGLVAFWLLSTAAFGFGVLLVGAVVVYDAFHKRTPFSPWIMALCRCLLYLVAGSAAVGGLTGATAWSSLVLGGYIVGLSYVAKGESTGGMSRGWPLLGLILPFVLAGFMNAPATWTSSAVIGPAAVYGFWTLRSLSHLYRPGSGGARNTVSGLLAGIVLVDALALAPVPWPWGAVFLALFVTALIFQRRIPAT